MPFAAESANTYSTEAREEARKAENKRKTEALEKIVKENFRPTIDDFSSSPIHRRFIRKDKEYVARNQRNFEYSKSADDQYHPKAIEYLVQFSINNGNLFYDEENESYTADSIWPTEFDDYSNRVDAAFFLRSSDFKCPVAFDITTKPDESGVREKILISSNDKNLGYPVGLTDIRYCRDEDGDLSWQTRVPKYCVGVDKRTIDDTLERSSVPEFGGLNIDKGQTALISFKILYEMSAQNQLFITPLMDEYSNGGGELTKEENQDLDNLGAIGLITQQELRRLTKELPSDIQLALGPADENGEYDPDKVANLFIDRNSAFRDKTFATIVKVTQSIQKDLDQSPYKISHLAELSFREDYKKTSIYRGFDEAAVAATRRSEHFYDNRDTKTPVIRGQPQATPQSQASRKTA